jgi:Carboxylesterase family
MIRKMTDIFTAFATNGNPNNHEIQEKWDQIETNELPFKCMNINQDKTIMMPLPEGDRLKTWDEIFKRENVETF